MNDLSDPIETRSPDGRTLRARALVWGLFFFSFFPTQYFLPKSTLSDNCSSCTMKTLNLILLYACMLTCLLAGVSGQETGANSEMANSELKWTDYPLWKWKEKINITPSHAIFFFSSCTFQQKQHASNASSIQGVSRSALPTRSA